MNKIIKWWGKLKYWHIGGILALILTFLIPWVGKIITGKDFLVDIILYPSYLICIPTRIDPPFCALYIVIFVNIIIGVILGAIVEKLFSLKNGE